uniref:sn-glycerol-3-phosphate transport system permease protein UgpE n=1 Tax=uncultured Spirochaetaceae bacterium TaxID=201186 RepID=A0A650ENY1_9SPIO|nr:sn-glycerol-3-phosphate transport system permease protein UgpE [uncultured Spirochaetaceae bacterium]
MVRNKKSEICKSVIVALAGIIIIAPIFLMFVASLKDDRYEIMRDMGSFRAFFVTHPSLNNYREVLFESVQNFGRAFINSIIVLTCTVLLTIFVSSMAGYAICRGKLKFQKILLVIILSLYIIPMESIMLPLMYQVTRWGITDTYAVQILPFIASPLYIFLFYQNFKAVPDSLGEACELEGASFWRTFKSVYLPMNSAPIITICILQGMDMWNQYLWPLLVTTEETVRPIAVSLSSFTASGGEIYWDQLMAASVVMLLPVLILFLFFQRHFMESVASSAVKG